MSGPFFIRKSRVRHLIWGPVAALAAYLVLSVISIVFELDPELYQDRGARSVLNIITTLILFATCAIFFLARKISRRFAISSAEDVLSWDTRRPVLYLRTFEDDKQLRRQDPKADALKWANPVLMLHRGIIGSVRFEEKLLAVCEQVGPFIGLGHPTDRNEDYSGAARFSPFGDEWKDIVQDLMDKSAVIIIRATSREGEGMLWELDQIAFQKLADKTILYIEFNASDDNELRQLRYEKYADMIQTRYGVTLPPFDPNKQFIFTPKGGETWAEHSFSLSHALSRIGYPAAQDDALPLAKGAAPGASWLRSPKVHRIADAQPSMLKAGLLVLFGLLLGSALGMLNTGLEATLERVSFNWMLDQVTDGADIDVDLIVFGALAIMAVFFPLALIFIGIIMGWAGGWLRLPGVRPYFVASFAAVITFHEFGYGGFLWPYLFAQPDTQLLADMGLPTFFFWFSIAIAFFFELLVPFIVFGITRVYSLSVAERDIAASWRRGEVFLDKPIKISRASGTATLQP